MLFVFRRVQSGKSAKPSKTHPAAGLDFDVFFEGENDNEDTEEDMLLRASPMDTDTFFSSMSKTPVPLMAQPPRKKLSMVEEEEREEVADNNEKGADFPMAIRMLNPESKR
jgi:hypothetical protein